MRQIGNKGIFIRGYMLPIQTSGSPEDKWGPNGYEAPGTAVGSEHRYILPGQTMPYRIEMWNKPEAPVPTQDAVINDVLDPAVFDLSTFHGKFYHIGARRQTSTDFYAFAVSKTCRFEMKRQKFSTYRLFTCCLYEIEARANFNIHYIFFHAAESCSCNLSSVPLLGNEESL